MRVEQWKMIKENLLIMYEQSFRDNWELPAFSDYGTDTLFRFCDMAEEIARLHLLFEYFQIFQFFPINPWAAPATAGGS